MSGLLNPLPALDTATEAALRESIRRFGVLVPVLIDEPSGEPVDGHHRVRIARELGVSYREQAVRLPEDPEERAQALADLNDARRQRMTPEQRREIVAVLRAQGHSQRAIAGAVGVNEKTIRNDVRVSGAEGSAPVTKSSQGPDLVTGRDDKKYPAAPRQLKNPATDKQLSYLRSLCERNGVEMPTGPLSKARASKLIDGLSDGPARLEAGPWLAKLRALVEEVERAAPVGPEFAPAQAWIGRLARVVGGTPEPAATFAAVPGREWSDDELQRLADSNGGE
jgi:ParB-like chromosome segregation protein Spo0J